MREIVLAFFRNIYIYIYIYICIYIYIYIFDRPTDSYLGNGIDKL